jgi:hypothetical protein
VASSAPERVPKWAARGVAAWVGEGVEHATASAYPADIAGGRDGMTGVLLPGSYGPAARPGGERRIVLARYRLVALLTMLFGPP